METEKKKYIYPKEKMQQYNKTFMEKHKDDRKTCEQCLKEYSIFARSHHEKSKFHINSLKIHELYKTED